MGLLTRNDATIWKGFFKECAKLRGIPALYRYVLSYTVSTHSEFNYQLSEPQEMDIIFNENPSVATLRKIGWMSENSDDKPYIAQLPFDAKDIQIGCTISIKDFDLDSTRDFKITSIKMILEFPDCWTCTLAPIFFTDEAKDNYTDSNYNYADTVDADTDSDSPDNKYGKEYIKDHPVIEPDSPNFSYLNVKE